MHDPKESDSAILATSPGNKAAGAVADWEERRAGTNENPGGRSTVRTQRRAAVSQGAERIRQFIARKPKEKLTALLHHVTPGTLRAAYDALKREAAPGVDGMTWDRYGEGLDERLLDLHDRVHAGTYRATPSRRVNIPKPDGGTRPLGVAALEDKIVQKAVVDNILTPIYEAEFLGFSYGFRPGRGAHDALDALAYGIEKRKVNWILDADIAKFFDRIDRDWILRFLGERIGDQRLIRLIGKWLRMGAMEDGQLVDTGKGTPQGSVISPVLANIYLHYVLDLWVGRKWRPQEARGAMIFVRYADDYVAGFQHRKDAERFLRDLKERLGQFGLELHPDKTRLIEFGRFAIADRKKRGQGRPETFDFLGMTHYCRQTRNGHFGLGRKPVAKRMSRTLKAIRAKLRQRMHADEVETGKWLGTVLRGWYNYFAVPTSYRYLARFELRVQREWLVILRRRSQKDRYPWERLQRLCDKLWPPVTVLHPWPTQRFAVTHRR